ncbi:hypothetical protein [Micromonospora sp. NPDC126480]|uniref:hypothetical protein n=1 Tax=Micromonospora sp. NPDC126480 TaxID=3155312 RepID=UPI003322DED0
MRTLRNWAPTLVWLAATVTSVALASVALLPVLRTAPAGAEALASVRELRRDDAGDEPPSVTTPAPPIPSSPPPSSAAPSATAPSAAATPTRAVGAQRTTTRDGWTVTTDAAGVATYLRSFRVEGGQTVVRASRGRVHLVTATPGPGYSAKTVQDTPDNLAVFFLETNHHFVIHVVWRDDAPFAQVSEVGG